MLARNSGGMTLTLPSDQEIVLTRVFNAPRSLVFEAWTNPEHVKQWYGCSIMTLSICEIDLRVGGAYRYVMRAPDGVHHAMQGVYREITPPVRLVYTERYVTEGFTSNDALVTVLFAEHDGMTTLTSTSLYQSKTDRDGHLATGMEGGAAETLDRLAALLAQMA
jgi:uncharacterized protein YndB with AHSA1/START domain